MSFRPENVSRNLFQLKPSATLKSNEGKICNMNMVSSGGLPMKTQFICQNRKTTSQEINGRPAVAIAYFKSDCRSASHSRESL
jgi:hypothetical protein